MIANHFMQLALRQAQLAFENNEVPIGAVIVENKEVIASSFNKNITNFDPTAHCEIIAIREACLQKKSPRLDNCDIYVTVEPCSMCFTAISLARINRLFFGVNDQKFGAISNNLSLFKNTQAYHKVEIYDGICALESKELLQKFFQIKRSMNHGKVQQKNLSNFNPQN